MHINCFLAFYNERRIKSHTLCANILLFLRPRTFLLNGLKVTNITQSSYTVSALRQVTVEMWNSRNNIVIKMYGHILFAILRKIRGFSETRTFLHFNRTFKPKEKPKKIDI